MSAPIEAPPDIGNLIASMGALFSAAPGERAEIIERWREHMREGRAGLQRQSQQFEALYKDVAEDRHLGFQGINDLAAAILEEQREAAKRILPAVEVLLKALAAHSDDPDLTLIFCEGLDISRITLENFG